MALTESTMVELGSPAPDFNLPDTNGNHISLDYFKSETLVVIFTCNHCPYAKAVEDRLVALGNGYEGRTDFVLISSNDVVNYPEDSPVKMAEKHKLKGYPFPYLFDETQEVAKKYGAEVPFIRPDELANDYATILPVIKHAIEWFEKRGQSPKDV